MPKLPFMKFFTTDWFAGTKLLTRDLRGAYIDLLCLIWEKGKLGKLRVSPRELAVLWQIPCDYFDRNQASDWDVQVDQIVRSLEDVLAIKATRIRDEKEVIAWYEVFQKRISIDQKDLISNAFRQKIHRKSSNGLSNGRSNGSSNAFSNRKVTPKISDTRSQITEVRKEEKEEEKNTTTDLAQNAKPTHVQFVDGFKQTYEALSKQPFAITKLDFITAKRLIDSHGLDNVVAKTKILGQSCRDGTLWFTKDGWGAFTIGTLSRHWNSILELKKLDPEEAKKQEFFKELKKAEEARERLNADR